MKKLIIAILLLCMAFGLCACGGNGSDSDISKDNSSENSVLDNSKEESKEESTPESEEESKPVFEVKAVDENGAPVANVMIQVCKDSCIPAKTNENGIATFNIEITDGYKLSVLSCPEGSSYQGEAEVYLESGITEYTVELVAGN